MCLTAGVDKFCMCAAVVLMLSSYTNRSFSFRSLRLEYRHQWFGTGRSQSWKRRWRFCTRRSCAVFGFYAIAVLLLQNSIITYHAAIYGSEPTTTINGSDNLPTKSTVHQNSVVVSSSSSSAAATVVVSAPLPSSQQHLQLIRHQQGQYPGLLTEQEYYRRRQHKVNEYRHNAVLVPSGLCRPDTFMVILVHSSPTNLDRREAIRVTWGDAVLKGTWPNTSQQNQSTMGRLQMSFVLGLHRDETVNRAIRQEHSRHNDIIQGDFIDNYHNMTLKSLLDLKVVSTHCPRVQYLLKSDDDMIINLPYLLDILVTKPLKRSFMGPYNPRSRVYRDGVWKLTLEEFPFPFYPPYESGSAYIITGDLIHELFVTSEYVPHIFVDDVYVTGILGRVLGVTHVRQRGFAYWGTKTPTACDVIRWRIITGTKMHPQRLCLLWDDLKFDSQYQC